MPTLEELEKRREDLLAERKKDEEAQLLIDLEKRFEIEEKYGPCAAVEISPFVKGYPARVFVRTPKEEEYDRYNDQLRKNHDKKSTKGQRDAQELLGKSCWVYPETPEERKRVMERFPGIVTALSVAALRLAEGKTEEEGKG